MLKSSAPTIMPVDLNDPTLGLYLPLWYPAEDLKGGTIYSYDKNRHTCTVTGTTWSEQGRTFDGLDDKIVVPAHSSIALTAGHTVIIWYNTVVQNNYQYVWGKYIDDDNFYGLNLGEAPVHKFVLRNTAVNHINQSAGTLNVGTWQMGTITTAAGGNDFKAYYDDTPDGTDTAYTLLNLSAVDFCIGSRGDGVSFVNIIVGEVAIYSREFSAGEVADHFNKTRWRYK